MPITFRQDIIAYAVGRRANMEEWNTITRTKEGSGTLAFGVPVMPGTGAHSCVILDATNGRNVLGITETSQVLPNTGDAYRQYDNVGICEKGVIGVLLGSDVTVGAAARFNTANSTWTIKRRRMEPSEPPDCRMRCRTSTIIAACPRKALSQADRIWW